MLNKSDCTSQRQDLFLQLHSSQMVCQHFHATQTTGMGHAKCHLRAKWCDSWGVLSFGQCREITWWDTSHVQPASYSGTPTQELHHSQVPLVGRSRWRIPRHPTGGSLGTVNACVTHTSFLIPISPALGMNKISLCMGCQFWDICANKDQLKKLWEDQAGLTISLLTMMGFATQTQNKKKTFWWCRPCDWTEIEILFLG